MRRTIQIHEEFDIRLNSENAASLHCRILETREFGPLQYIETVCLLLVSNSNMAG